MNSKNIINNEFVFIKSQHIFIVRTTVRLHFVHTSTNMIIQHHHQQYDENDVYSIYLLYSNYNSTISTCSVSMIDCNGQVEYCCNGWIQPMEMEYTKYKVCTIML